jgi:hypothetical protein
MTGFSTDSLAVKTADGLNMVLAEPFSFTRPNGEVHNFPSGMTSNGASIPRVLWATLPPFGKYWMAAFAHDYLYRGTELSKDTCDTMLDEMMVALAVNAETRKIIYEGVHLCGWIPFSRDRTKEAAA